MIGHNRFNEEQAQGFLARLTNLDAEHASERSSLMAGLKADKQGVYDEAEAAGIPPKILKKVYATIKKVREAGKPSEGLDLDEASQFALLFDAVKASLGEFADTPLGQAALAAVEAEGPAADDKPKRQRRNAEDRAAGKAAALAKSDARRQAAADAKREGGKAKPQPKDPRQADLDEAARAATAADEVNVDPEVERMMGRTHAERAAEQPGEAA